MSELNDPLAFFDGDVKAPAASAAPEPAAPSAQEPASPPAAAAPSADAAGSAAPAGDDSFPNAPAGYVPVRALQDERAKRQTLEQVVQGFKQAPAPAATPAPQAPPAPPRPLPAIGTPEHGAYLQDQLFQQQVSSKFDRSEFLAITAHGAETVLAAKKFAEANQDPTWWMGVIESPDPYGRVIAEMQAQEAAKNWNDNKSDWEQFQAWKASQAAGGDAPAPAGGQAPAPAPTVVAPSVAAAQVKAAQKPSTAPVSRGSILATPAAHQTKPGEVTTGGGEAFGQAFR